MSDASERAIKHRIGNAVHEFNSYYQYNTQYPLKADENPTLWRYMGLSKFVSLLDNSSLFFAKPKNFSDKYEGHFSKYDVVRQQEAIIDSLAVYNLTLSDYVNKCREYAGVICWHMNEYESAAMWDLYLDSNEGIAIKTTFERLMDSITDRRYFIHPGKVQYIDFNKDMASDNVFEALFYKRKSFSHENELRLIALADPIVEDGYNFNGYKTMDGEVYEGTTQLDSDYGATIKCDVQTLIGAVYIAPKAPKWFSDVVISILNKYGLSDVEVIHSDLDQDMIY